MGISACLRRGTCFWPISIFVSIALLLLVNSCFWRNGFEVALLLLANSRFWRIFISTVWGLLSLSVLVLLVACSAHWISSTLAVPFSANPFDRLGSSLSVFGDSRFGATLSVLKCASVGSSLSTNWVHSLFDGNAFFCMTAMLWLGTHINLFYFILFFSLMSSKWGELSCCLSNMASKSPICLFPALVTSGHLCPWYPVFI